MSSDRSVENSKIVLVTGGCGYIGSHACVALSASGYQLVVLDNLSNSRREVLDRLARLCGAAPIFYQGDIRDARMLDSIFAAHQINAIFHFAGLKAVGESVREPLKYYDNNVGGTAQLLMAMQRAEVTNLIFSSSATVYGDQPQMPVRETAALGATNPYGRSKLMIETMLNDLHRADARWRIGVLRYFNPAGAHESGLIGEYPLGIPNNLVPFIAQVASGQRDRLEVWGNSYPTPDGTGVRDYIHVMDLVQGHVAAYNYLLGRAPTIVTANLGTGRGTSVLEMIRAFEHVCGKSIPYQVSPPRDGDVAQSWAATDYAEQVFGWRAKRSVEQTCADAWRWQEAQA